MLFKKSSSQFECSSAIKNDMKLPIALSVIKVTSNKEEDCPVKLLQPDEIYIIKTEFLIYDKWKVRLPLSIKGTFRSDNIDSSQSARPYFSILPAASYR